MHQALTSPVTAPGPADSHAYSTNRALPERSLPRMALAMVVLLLLGMLAWEARMRSLGLQPGDFDDFDADWARERRALNAGPGDAIAIVGDSRIFFDTDLGAFEELAGRRPIQLALQGTNGRYFLQELADEPHFRGLAVVGMALPSFFSNPPGLRGRARQYWRTQSPAQRFGHAVYSQLAEHLAFLDGSYTPITLLRWMDMPERDGVSGPWLGPWKVFETRARRQAFMWSRQWQDPAMAAHNRRAWMSGRGMPRAADVIDRVIRDAVGDVARIRARGGEVVFVCPPVGGELRARQDRVTPRHATWDRLIAETGAVGIHWEDYPDMQGLDLPEWSHLSRESATRFTQAYVREAIAQVPWLRARTGQWRRQ